MRKHFAATVYILALVDDEVKVLLHKHKKHNIWLGVGGHVESFENPLEAAIREVKEEANVTVKIIDIQSRRLQTSYVAELTPPVYLFEEHISARADNPEHYHIDCVYFGLLDDPSKVKMAEECRWFSLTDLEKEELEEDVRLVAENAIRQGKNYLL